MARNADSVFCLVDISVSIKEPGSAPSSSTQNVTTIEQLQVPDSSLEHEWGDQGTTSSGPSTVTTSRDLNPQHMLRGQGSWKVSRTRVLTIRLFNVHTYFFRSFCFLSFRRMKNDDVFIYL